MRTTCLAVLASFLLVACGGGRSTTHDGGSGGDGGGISDAAPDAPQCGR